MSTPTDSLIWIKDPDATLDYEFDWAAPPPLGPWLPDGDTITASTWAVPEGITKASDSHTDTTTTIWLSGGTAGASYKLTNHITTAAGRIDDRSRYITVKDR